MPKYNNKKRADHCELVTAQVLNRDILYSSRRAIKKVVKPLGMHVAVLYERDIFETPVDEIQPEVCCVEFGWEDTTLDKNGKPTDKQRGPTSTVVGICATTDGGVRMIREHWRRLCVNKFCGQKDHTKCKELLEEKMIQPWLRSGYWKRIECLNGRVCFYRIDSHTYASANVPM
jgi:hypothetical protein